MSDPLDPDLQILRSQLERIIGDDPLAVRAFERLFETVQEGGGGGGGGVSKHSELILDDGTNPHSTTKTDVGLSAVTNNLQLTAADAASNANGEGASLIGIEDAAGNYTATDVEGALAEAATGGGSFSTFKYDTGWVANSDWTNVEFNITHNLSEDFTNLMIFFYISPTGAQSDAVFPITISRVVDVGGSFNQTFGVTAYQTGANSFKLQTGNSGIQYVDEDGTEVEVDSESWYYRVVVYNPNQVAQATTAQSYTTGWVANSAWQTQEFTISHGLNAPLSELITKFYVSTDGTEANSFEPFVVDVIQDGVGTNFKGLTNIAIDNNSFKFQTGIGGVPYVDDTGSVTTLISQSYYYKAVVYKPEVIASVAEATSYDTGWNLQSASWAGANFTVNHGLATHLSGLIAKLYLSTDGTEATSREVLNTVQYDTGSFTLGAQFQEVDTNSFEVQIGSTGYFMLNSSTGAGDAIQNENYYWRVVCYKPDVIATVNQTLKYDTGWVANSNWYSQSFTIPHGLGANLDGLIPVLLLSSDGTDANGYAPSSGAVEDGDRNVGWSFSANDSNSILLDTASEGLRVVPPGGGITYLGNATSYYYRVVVYHPQVLQEVQDVGVHLWVGATSLSQAIPNATETVIQHNTVFTDTRNAWDASNYEFVCPEAGVYQINASTLSQNATWTEGEYWQIRILVNDEIKAIGGRSEKSDTVVSYEQAQQSLAIPLAVGDRVSSAIFHNQGSNTNIYNATGGWQYTYLTVTKTSGSGTFIAQDTVPVETTQDINTSTTLPPTAAENIYVTTASSDLTITLPLGSTLSAGWTRTIHKVDSGTGEVDIGLSGSDTLDGTSGRTFLYSQWNKIKVQWTGSAFTILELQSDGVSGQKRWQLFANGTMEQWEDSSQNVSITSAYGSSFLGNITFSFPQNFIDTNYVIHAAARWTTGGSWVGAQPQSDAVGSSTWYVIDDFSRASSTTRYYWKATGRWRT